MEERERNEGDHYLLQVPASLMPGAEAIEIATEWGDREVTLRRTCSTLMRAAPNNPLPKPHK
jgi:hypothetical protein